MGHVAAPVDATRYRLLIFPRKQSANVHCGSPLPAHQPQPVTRRIVQVLPQAQVALGSLDRGMPQRNLDLFERRAAEVGELG